MTQQLAIAVALAVVMGALMVTLLYALVHRWLRGRRRRHRADLLRRVRPYLMAAAAGDEDEGEEGEEDEKAGEEGEPPMDEALARIPAGVFEEAAVDLLGKLRGDAHANVVALLAQYGTLAAARRRLRSRKADDRAWATHLLGAAGDATAVDDIARLLDDPVQEVTLVAARSLGKMHDPAAVQPLLHALDRPRAVPAGIVATSLLHLGRAGIKQLEQGLTTEGPTARVAAAEVLGRLGAMDATDILIGTLLEDPEPEARTSSARALGQIGSPKAAGPLSETLAVTDSVGLRAACAEALGEVGTRDTVPLLVSTIESPDHEVALSAAEALAALGPPGLTALETLASGHGRVAGYAREVLGEEYLQELRGTATGETAAP